MTAQDILLLVAVAEAVLATVAVTLAFHYRFGRGVALRRAAAAERDFVAECTEHEWTRQKLTMANRRTEDAVRARMSELGRLGNAKRWAGKRA